MRDWRTDGTIKVHRSRWAWELSTATIACIKTIIFLLLNQVTLIFNKQFITSWLYIKICFFKHLLIRRRVQHTVDILSQEKGVLVMRYQAYLCWDSLVVNRRHTASCNSRGFVRRASRSTPHASSSLYMINKHPEYQPFISRLFLSLYYMAGHNVTMRKRGSAA